MFLVKPLSHYVSTGMYKYAGFLKEGHQTTSIPELWLCPGPTCEFVKEVKSR